ncbi:MAG: 1-deoxy-D-xylulose-5-phosphate synthase [Prevotellaceae bacterium]|jgi:1-deoxy-D-xylulose-5-phosphate synthase|nr:1-deoxy-D-xylulose-5-phosphate synthase [Prevotellaceae bacterium]
MPIENCTSLLSLIHSPKDLKKLSVNQLPQLCDELRGFIIRALANNPGHLGASLGVVELTVAIHYVYQTPHDRLIWDVGHQAYAHKILTERRDRFHTNRQFGGLCGFPSPRESEYDSFGTGHASTSISAALGMSIAARLRGESRHVVAVIGDGALTGGLAFEGLNNASTNLNDLLIILNDNQMAIDPISGGWSKFLTNIHTSKTYNHVRYRIYNGMRRLHLIDEEGRKRLIRFTNSLKSFTAKIPNNIFEGLNIRYFGAVDGHDVVALVAILQEIKEHKGPRVLHCITHKGKGYEPAENAVTLWHAPGTFNPVTGLRIVANDANQPPLYHDVFGKTLVELADANPAIVAITPAMPSGCGMTYMMEKYPDRTFDVGIAEGHAVTFSAGLAKEGLMPFCNIYSSFMQRAYDNVIHDVALQKLPVVFCLDRAGIVGSDGATHQGQFDLAYFRCVPNLTIAAPRNEHDLRNLMFTAQQPDRGAFVIRYPRGKGRLVEWQNPMEQMPIGKGICLKEGKTAAILSLGTIGYAAEEAINIVESQSDAELALYDMRFLKPLDYTLLDEIGERYSVIFTVEDGVINGGFGSAVAEYLCAKGLTLSIIRIGIPDRFIEHGTPAELYRMLGMDAEGIAQTVIKTLRNELTVPQQDKL